MKTLSEQVDLTGKVEVITVTELRSRPGDCLTQVELGKTYAVSRCGKVIAFIVPTAGADVIHEIMPDGSCATLNLPPIKRELSDRAKTAGSDFGSLDSSSAKEPSSSPSEACGFACCDRAGEYNGFGSDGPRLFTCPERCPCHD